MSTAIHPAPRRTPTPPPVPRDPGAEDRNIVRCPNCGKAYRLGENPPSAFDCRACDTTFSTGSGPSPRKRAPRPDVFRGGMGRGTATLMALNVLVFLGVCLATGASLLDVPAETLRDVGGTYAPWTFGGEPWRLFTSMFLHAGVMHLGMNMVYLWLLGSVVEKRLGVLQFLGLYVASGLLAALGSTLVHDNLVSVGASGAIFGLLGVLAAMAMHPRTRLESSERKQIGQLALTLIGLEILGFASPSTGDVVVDHAAHVVGLVAGLILATLAIELRVRRLAQPMVAGVLLLISITTLVAPAAMAAPGQTVAAHKRVEAVEGPMLEQLKATLGHYDDGSATGPETAEAIERGGLATLTSLADELAAMDASESRAGRYVTNKLEALRTMVEALRSGSQGDVLDAAQAYAAVQF